MGYNYAIPAMGAYGADPAFLQAFLTANPNSSVSFKGAQTQSAVPSTDTSISDDSKKQLAQIYAQKNESSGAGWWIAGAAATALAAGAMIKGKGNPVKGIKALWKSGKELLSPVKEEIAEATGKAVQENKPVITNLTAVRDAHGNIRYIVPGHTRKANKAGDIQTLIRENGIDIKKLISRKGGTSTIQRGQFVIEDGGMRNLVEFENGKIKKITNITNQSSPQDITNKFVGRGQSTKKKDVAFREKLESTIESITNQEEKYTSGIQELEYDVVRKLGDETATITFRPHIKPYKGAGTVDAVGIGNSNTAYQIKSLTSLDRVNYTDDAVQSYLYSHPEEAKVFSKLKKGTKVPNNSVIAKCEFGFKGSTVRIENGEIVGIARGGKFYKKGTKECDAYLNKHEKDILSDYEKIGKGKTTKTATDVTCYFTANAA